MREAKFVYRRGASSAAGRRKLEGLQPAELSAPGLGSPSRAEIAFAAAFTWRARLRSRVFVRRWVGPVTPTAATGTPVSSLTGAAMPRTPTSYSSSSVA